MRQQLKNPRQVINSINNFYTNYNSNIQRGVYFFADKATNKYEESRGLISKLLNASRLKEEVIFTSGVTHSIKHGCIWLFKQLYCYPGMKY